MTVLQHYYTSCVNEATGISGFQVQAMAPGISPEIQALIQRLIGYRIPPTCSDHDTIKHPIALRYYYVNEQQSILLCSQSSGSDEHGRPGNFFAHTVVLPPDNLTIMIPILYWKSPFWLKQYDGKRQQLSVSPGFEAEPSLDTERIFDFLAGANRREQFYALMCAVIHSHKTNRRIILIDDAETVAWWIAAVSIMLPPMYRPLLSFATYHHDPYQSPFLITGTTPDSSFRAAPEEYYIYFVLNGTTTPPTISKVEYSSYAALAKYVQNPTLYQERLQPLFAYYMQRFPASSQIDERLDMIAHYAHVIQSKQEHVLTDEKLAAVHQALESFEHLSIYSQEDIDELKQIDTAVWFSMQRKPELHSEYARIVKLLTQHKVPSDEIIKKQLTFYLERIGKGDALEHTIPGFANLQKLYGTQALIDNINRDAYLKRLQQLVNEAQPALLEVIWRTIGPYLIPGSLTQDIWVESLSVLGHAWKDPTTEGLPETLFNTIKSATTAHAVEWLRIAVASHGQLPDRTLLHFYCKLVYPLKLEQSEPYRAVIQTLYPRILYHELEYEVHKANWWDAPAIISRFIAYTRAKKIEPVHDYLLYGVRLLKQLYLKQGDLWNKIVPEFLTREELAPYLQQVPEIEQMLVQTFFASISLSQFFPEHVQIYQRYKDFPSLSHEQKVIINGLLAMDTGQVVSGLIEPLHTYLAGLPPEKYQQEAERFISQSLIAENITTHHKNMIAATFVEKQHPLFWDRYWHEITQMANFLGNDAVELMESFFSFWFSVSPNAFREPYIVQNFFLELPLRLGVIQQEQEMQKALGGVIAHAGRHPWYPLLYDVLNTRKNLFAALGQNLKTHLPRMIAGQKDVQDVRQRTQKMEMQVENLFIGQFFSENHKTTLPTMYSLEQRSLFWNCYWKQFSQFALTRDIEQVLELLSFWFDRAFQYFTQSLSIPQDFFLGLLPMLEMLKKERQFRKRAVQIHTQATQNIDRYPWYTLVQHTLAEQQGSLFSFFKGESR